MDIQDLRIFARVAAVQNLSAVGAELGLTPGTISKRIQAMEEDLSARLFDRTTRSIRITDEGAIFLAHVERILIELDNVRAIVADKVGKAKGRIKVTAPVSLARAFVMPAMLAFLEAFPEIEMQLDMTDRLVNLQDDGYDLALHIGALPDSALIAKRLATDRQMLVASPRYLQRAGVPQRAEDLADHSCLALCDTMSWTFNTADGETNVRIGGRFRCDNSAALALAACEGHGIVRISEFQIKDQLADGLLVPVLAGIETAGNWGIWALYPSSKHVMPRLRVLLDFLADWFRDLRAHAEPGHKRRALPDHVYADRVVKVAAN